MASTYSPILRTELIGSGDQAGAWGSTTNSNFQYIFEAAIAGYVAITVSPSSNNQVLTYVNGPSSSSALDQAVYAMLKLNAGTLGANFNIFAPPVSKTFIVWNNTSYTATFYNSTIIGNTTAAGSGTAIPAGGKALIWSDGTNFWGNDTVAGNLFIAGNLTVSGNETITGTLGVTGVATFTAQPIMSSLTASSAVATDASKGLVSVANTGTGSNVLATSPTLVTPALGTPTALVGTNITGTATGLSIGGNAATATTATTATNATNLATTNFTITESGGKLLIKYGATTVASISSTGAITSANNVTAYGTP